MLTLRFFFVNSGKCLRTFRRNLLSRCRNGGKLRQQVSGESFQPFINIHGIVIQSPVFKTVSIIAKFNKAACVNSTVHLVYRVHISYRRILQNHIFTNTEQKCMMLLPFEIEMSAVP